MKIKNLKEAIDYLYKINENNPNRYYGEYKCDMLDYNIDEGKESLEWYKAILEKVKKYKPKRVIDVGSNINLFGYLFANEGIEYIYNDYYNVREQFNDDIIISCLCIGYLIPIKDVKGKILIVNDGVGTGKNYRCTAKEIKIRRN